MTRTDTTGFYYQPDVSPHSYNGFYQHNRGVKVNQTLCEKYPKCTYWGGVSDGTWTEQA